jgi:hypothetical protein
MKKIISIILGIMLMLSMSITSFAAWAPETTTVAPTTEATTQAKVEKISITVDYAWTDNDAQVEDANDPLTSYKCRKCEFTITVKNDTNTPMSGAVISAFEPVFTSTDGKIIPLKNAVGSGFDKDKLPADTGISKGDSKEFTYVAYVGTTEKNVDFITVNVLGEEKTLRNQVGGEFNFVWVIDEDITEDNTTTTLPSEDTSEDASEGESESTTQKVEESDTTTTTEAPATTQAPASTTTTENSAA